MNCLDMEGGYYGTLQLPRAPPQKGPTRKPIASYTDCSDMYMYTIKKPYNLPCAQEDTGLFSNSVSVIRQAQHDQYL